MNIKNSKSIFLYLNKYKFFFSYYILTLFYFLNRGKDRKREGVPYGRLVGEPLAFFKSLLKSNIMGVFGSLIMIMLLVTAFFGIIATLIQVIKDFNDLD